MTEYYVIWTGDNVDEVEEFANDSDFGFTVGSTIHSKKLPGSRLLFRLAAWIEDFAQGGRNPKVLEIYPDRTDSEEEKAKDHAKLERVYNRLTDEYQRINMIDFKMIEKIAELIDNEFQGDYIPWHWTSARPGDKIHRDGTVERASELTEGRKSRVWLVPITIGGTAMAAMAAMVIHSIVKRNDHE